MTTTVATLMTRFTADTTEFTRGASQVEGRMDGMGRSTQRTMQAVNRGLTVMSTGIIAAGVAGVAAFTRFEDSFANVRKTVDGSEEEFARLEATIRRMATDTENPLSAMDDAANTLANVMALGGQLGVGIDDLEDFTQVMGELGVATNLSAEEAATMLAQFANITGMDLSQVRQAGDALVNLGNNLAANEKDIMETAGRIGAAGERAGLAAPEILGFAGALSAVGLSAQLGGGNFSRFLNAISGAVAEGGPDLQKLGEMVGMTGDEFREAFESDPAGAVQDLLGALGEVPPDELMNFLDDLGIGGSEMVDVIGRLATNTGLVAQAQTLANEGWNQGGQLVAEAGAKAETTQGAFNRLKNNANELAISIGQGLNPVVKPLVERLTGAVGVLAEFLAQNPDVVQGIAALAGGFMALKTAVTLFGIAAGVAGVAAAPLVASVAALAATAYVGSEVIGTFADAMAPIDTPEMAQEMALSTGRMYNVGGIENYTPGVPRMYGTGPQNMIPTMTALDNINAAWGNTGGSGAGGSGNALGAFGGGLAAAREAAVAADNFAASAGNAALAAQDMQAAIAMGAEELPNTAERYNELGERVMALAETNAQAMNSFGETMLGVIIPSGESTRRLSSDVGNLQTQIAGLNAAGVVERVEGPMNQLALVVGAAMGKSAEEVVALQTALNNLSVNLSGVMSDLSGLGTAVGETFNIPGFAGGGWTGGGSGVAGVVHGGEYVVPQGGAMVYPTPDGLMMSGASAGGGGGGNNVQLNVYTNDAMQIVRELRRIGINIKDMSRDTER